MTSVRKTYQRAIVTPTHHVEQLWRDYENFENSVSRALVGLSLGTSSHTCISWVYIVWLSSLYIQLQNYIYVFVKIVCLNSSEIFSGLFWLVNLICVFNVRWVTGWYPKGKQKRKHRKRKKNRKPYLENLEKENDVSICLLDYLEGENPEMFQERHHAYMS